MLESIYLCELVAECIAKHGLDDVEKLLYEVSVNETYIVVLAYEFLKKAGS